MTVIQILKQMIEESYSEEENLHSDSDEENQDQAKYESAGGAVGH